MADSDLVALIRQQTTQSTRLRQAVERAVRQGWTASVTDLTDESLQRWIDLIVPLMLGVKEQQWVLTAANLAEVISLMTGDDLAPAPVEPVDGLRGVPDEQVYARPVVEVRALISQGVPGGEAFRRGLRRAVTTADTDIEMITQRAARSTMLGEPRVVGYRRVLTGARSCGICAVASTQRYQTADLMPIHASCDCGVAPIVGTQDPGQVINEGLLDTLGEAVVERFGPTATRKDWRSLTVVKEHGELGPVLSRTGDNYMTTAGAVERG